VQAILDAKPEPETWLRRPNGRVQAVFGGGFRSLHVPSTWRQLAQRSVVHPKV
jgi:hypothetical protein